MDRITIPKVIHYCWFGHKSLPALAIKCIESWKKYLPDYEIKEWNEDNFDVYITTYTEEAYRLKKYAFVSDYARFWILYHYGGVYFDTDVEIIKSINKIIDKGPFMGFEKTTSSESKKLIVAPGLGFGCNSGLGFGKTMLDFYHNKHYISWKGRMTGTVVNFTTEMLLSKNNKETEHGILLCEGIYIYPDDYFDPLNYYTKELTFTENTRCIHHYAASWTDCKKGLSYRIKEKYKYFYTRFYVSIRKFINLK